MPTPFVYAPILKGKANDLKALSRLTAEARALIKPLVELLPIPPDRSTDEHLNAFAHHIVKHAKAGDLFVDFWGLLPGTATQDGRDATTAGFQILRKLGRPVTPTYGFDRDDAVWAPLRAEVKRMAQGFCFRIDIDDLDDKAQETWTELLERSADLELAPKALDLLLDLRHVAQRSTNELKELVTDFLAYKPLQNKYRSIIVAGSSALKDVAAIPKDDTGEVIRKELRVWVELQADVGSSVTLTFGDYGVVHPDFTDGGPNQNANAKIRYTLGGRIFVFRGHKLFKPTDFKQYHALAERVRNSQAYRGRDFSYGDSYIDDCADYNKGPGNMGCWVLADMNHHIEYTAKQLQDLVEKVDADISEDEIDELLELA